MLRLVCVVVPIPYIRMLLHTQLLITIVYIYEEFIIALCNTMYAVLGAQGAARCNAMESGGCDCTALRTTVSICRHVCV